MPGSWGSAAPRLPRDRSAAILPGRGPGRGGAGLGQESSRAWHLTWSLPAPRALSPLPLPVHSSLNRALLPTPGLARGDCSQALLLFSQTWQNSPGPRSCFAGLSEASPEPRPALGAISDA